MSEALMSNENGRGSSLIERAAEVYDFGAALRGRSTPVAPEAPVQPAVAPDEPVAVAPAPVEEAIASAPAEAIAVPPPATVVSAPLPRPAGRVAAIDRKRLREDGFIVPDAPIGTLAEEFRLVKRQLLLRAAAETNAPAPKNRMILVCSAQPNDGKTFCAVNLALSLASERDNEVLLVDADVAKPQVLSTLGIDGDAGLIDAISDPNADVESFIIQTDIPKLSVLPAGKATNNDTELLSSARATQLMESLHADHPRRIVIVDSAPALAASPASVLAHRVGRVLMVVRADRTTEGELREAIGLLDGCDDISLLLNGTSFFGTNRTYGSYYGQESK